MMQIECAHCGHSQWVNEDEDLMRGWRCKNCGMINDLKE